MSIILTSGVGKSLKAVLDNVITDPVQSGKDKLLYPRWMADKTMSDNYEIDQEVGGTMLLQEKAEGAASAVGTIQEGYETRYIARTQSLHLHVAEEAIEDSKYDKYINAARRLTRSAYKTMDIDATNVFIRSTTSGFNGGDGVVLGSASHTLPYGSTWSNIADTYQTPSRAALIAAITKAGKYPSQSTITEGYMIEKIVCPLAQWAVWEGIIGSAQVPDSNNNELNVVGPRGSHKGIEIVPLKYADAATTTAWAAITDADNGVQWRTRVKLRTRTWVDNDADIMKYGVRYRAARGWSDARGWYQGNT